MPVNPYPCAELVNGQSEEVLEDRTEQVAGAKLRTRTALMDPGNWTKPLEEMGPRNQAGTS